MPRGRRLRREDGTSSRGGWYEWRGERYVPSWGGSMFEALMPRLLIDEERLAPGSLGPNGVAHARVQRRWAEEELGHPVWGLSPCLRPDGGYGEYGVRVLGSAGYGAGAVTPHASALALLVTPDAAIRNLHTLATRYPLYGDFGFYDALAPDTGRVARGHLTLDQAMIFLAATSHLTGGALQARFATDPTVRHAAAVLADERFLE